LAFLLNIIPVTMVAAFAKGPFCRSLWLPHCFAVAALSGRRARASGSVDQHHAVVFSIVEMIVKLSPIGAFAPWPSPSTIRPSFPAALS